MAFAAWGKGGLYLSGRLGAMQPTHTTLGRDRAAGPAAVGSDKTQSHMLAAE